MGGGRGEERKDVTSCPPSTNLRVSERSDVSQLKDALSRGLPVRKEADWELGLENHFMLQKRNSFVHAWEKMRAFGYLMFKTLWLTAFAHQPFCARCQFCSPGLPLSLRIPRAPVLTITSQWAH